MDNVKKNVDDELIKHKFWNDYQDTKYINVKMLGNDLINCEEFFKEK